MHSISAHVSLLFMTDHLSTLSTSVPASWPEQRQETWGKDAGVGLISPGKLLFVRERGARENLQIAERQALIQSKRAAVQASLGPSSSQAAGAVSLREYAVTLFCVVSVLFGLSWNCSAGQEISAKPAGR